MVIFAGGLGKELTGASYWPPTTGEYQSPPFWSDDFFEAPNFGMRNVPNGILVSGAGDGALQDFIRLVTGHRSARDIWFAVEPVLTDARLRRIERLADWDRNTQDRECLAPAFGALCDRLAALHARYVAEIEDLASSASEWPPVLTLLTALIDRARPIDKVFLALKADHFEGCYPLNRLVALLLVRYLGTMRPRHQPLLLNTAVRAVQLLPPSGPAPFAAIVAQPTSCTTTPDEIKAWPGAPTPRLFDAVIIRHGIDTTVLSIKSSRLVTQVVPQHLP